MAVFWKYWHEAPGGQVLLRSSPALPQTRAQLMGFREPWVSSRHCGMAVVPVGTSEGQGCGGEQEPRSKLAAVVEAAGEYSPFSPLFT
jgi:hypothetical protein